MFVTEIFYMPVTKNFQNACYCNIQYAGYWNWKFQFVCHWNFQYACNWNFLVFLGIQALLNRMTEVHQKALCYFIHKTRPITAITDKLLSTNKLCQSFPNIPPFPTSFKTSLACVPLYLVSGQLATSLPPWANCSGGQTGTLVLNETCNGRKQWLSIFARIYISPICAFMGWKTS